MKDVCEDVQVMKSADRTESRRAREHRRGPWARRLGLLALMLSALGACGDGDREARRSQLGPDPTLEQRMAVADPSAGASLFGPCLACHTIGRGGPDLAGPNLHGVMGAPIGRRLQRYGSTAALRSVGGVWTEAAMDAWLASPSRFAPGTKMNYPGMADPLERADLIAYLASQSR